MPKKEEAPSSPYQMLRKNRPIKIDIHSSSAAVNNSTSPSSPPPLSLSSPPLSSSSTASTSSSFPSSSSGRKNVWIKPKNNSVQVFNYESYTFFCY